MDLAARKEFICDVVNSAEFQASNIWNGKKVAEDLSLAIKIKITINYIKHGSTCKRRG
ncbi:MAG: hypothetical protein U0V48_11425 [Anaerolineales bacterium]